MAPETHDMGQDNWGAFRVKDGPLPVNEHLCLSPQTHRPMRLDLHYQEDPGSGTLNIRAENLSLMNDALLFAAARRVLFGISGKRKKFCCQEQLE